VDGRTASALEDLCANLELLQNEMRELKAQRKECSPQAKQKVWDTEILLLLSEARTYAQDCEANKAQRRAQQSRRTNDFKAKTSSRRIRTGDNTPINASLLGMKAGLYIEMDVCAVKAKLLVDTGATMTLISNCLLYRISKGNWPKLSSLRRAFLNASG
jgi:hypothetical protein